MCSEIDLNWNCLSEEFSRPQKQGTTAGRACMRSLVELVSWFYSMSSTRIMHSQKKLLEIIGHESQFRNIDIFG